MTIGFVCGAFDLLHAGHIYMLKQAKLNCDFLIVGLHIDPEYERPDKNSPVESILERQIKLEGCKFVDKVVVYKKEEDILLMLKYFNVNKRFLGADYADRGDKIITEEFAVPIMYLDSLPIHSSDIRKRL